MTDRTQPEAVADCIFRLRGLRHVDRHEVAHAMESMVARIADLEAQLEAIGAGGVSGPLVGQPQAMPDLTALTERGSVAWAGVDAQGLRDGVASVAANAGSEPAAHLWQHCETGRTRIVMPDMIVDADARWQVVGPLYLGAAPPTAQAEGWTKPHRTITYTCPVCAASLERQE